MTDKTTVIAPGVQSQQASELRVQVNGAGIKTVMARTSLGPATEHEVYLMPVGTHAKIVGKVPLENLVKRELTGKPKPPKPVGPVVQKRLKRADDRQAQQAGNQQQLQELNYVKGKLKDAEFKLGKASSDSIFFRIQLRCLIDQILAAGTSEGVTKITSEPSFQLLNEMIPANKV